MNAMPRKSSIEPTRPRTAEERATPGDPLHRDRLNRSWHLAADSHEVAVTDLEFAIFRVWEAFTRWQAACLSAVGGDGFSGSDSGVLHVIRMREAPKSISEIARLLNRDDMSNIQYSLRKLTKAGLIHKVGSGGKRGVLYEVTPKGKDLTERYSEVRRSLLLSLTRSVHDWEHDVETTGRILNLFTGMYEQAARVAATYRYNNES